MSECQQSPAVERPPASQISRERARRLIKLYQGDQVSYPCIEAFGYFLLPMHFDANNYAEVEVIVKRLQDNLAYHLDNSK